MGIYDNYEQPIGKCLQMAHGKRPLCCSTSVNLRPLVAPHSLYKVLIGSPEEVQEEIRRACATQIKMRMSSNFLNYYCHAQVSALAAQA